MTDLYRKITARREWFRSAARGAGLAALAALAAFLPRRRSDDSAAGQSCANRGICRGCSALTGCGLPEALSFRQATEER